MPRDKQFDVEAALDRAKDLFWQRGYEATSMAELLERMGINRGSFYDTFQSKRHVLLAALERYDTVHRRGEIRAAADGLAPRQAILAVFHYLADGSRCAQGRQGCFLVNSALELAPADTDVARIVRGGFTGIARFFTRLIAMGQVHGEINRGLDAAQTGRALMTQLLGLMVLVRSGASRAVRESVITHVERLLE